MRHIASMAVVLAALAGSACGPERREPDTPPGSWRPLFDGEQLVNWVNPYDHGQAWVENGEIHLRSDRRFCLATRDTYQDFVLELEVRMPATDVDAGVHFRSRMEPGRVFGYQADLDTRGRGWIGGIIDVDRRGWLQPLPDDPESVRAYRQRAGDCFKRNTWNSVRIECKGSRVRVFINGVQTADVRDGVDLRGHFALEHGGASGAVVRFRNIRLRDLRVGIEFTR